MIKKVFWFFAPWVLLVLALAIDGRTALLVVVANLLGYIEGRVNPWGWTERPSLSARPPSAAAPVHICSQCGGSTLVLIDHMGLLNRCRC